MKLHKIIGACLLSGLCATGAFSREVISFNDGWLFKKGPFATDMMKAAAQWEGKWTEVTIPHTWNAKDMQVKTNSFYEGAAYYRKTYLIPETMKGKRLFLRFEGVGTCTEVYVNGYLVGHTPF